MQQQMVKVIPALLTLAQPFAPPGQSSDVVVADILRSTFNVPSCSYFAF